MRTARTHSAWQLLAIAAVCMPFLGFPAGAKAETLTVTVPTGTVGDSKYVIVFANIAIGLDTFSAWFETLSAVLTGSPPDITVKNTGGADVTLSDVKFFTSDTLIPLDNLNYVDEPPSNSLFVPIPSLDGSLISGASKTETDSQYAEGGSPESLDAVATPLPAPWTTMLLGLAVLGLLACRNTRQVTPAIKAA